MASNAAQAARGVIDWSGAPAGPSVNGVTGEPGVNGAVSTDSSPGKDGQPGKPGGAGVNGQAGGDGRDMYVVLSAASDEQHVHVSVGNLNADYALPLLLRSNGGVGATGGNGGTGGVGGNGGDGCKYVAHDERKKYKWQLVGGYGLGHADPSASAPVGAKKRTASAGATQAQQGVQADAPRAGPATSMPAMPAGIPTAQNKKKLSTWLEHMAWDLTLWRAMIAEDGTSFIIVRNGQTSIANGLHIMDWYGERWVITIENKHSFVYMSPDPAAPNARPSFRVGALQYLDWMGTPCEVKIHEAVIPPVMKLSNGGHGAQGGPGGAAGPGGNGGNGGHIIVATTDPSLLLQIQAECNAGSGGLAGQVGPGGRGGMGGKGQVVGMIGPDGILGIESPPGKAGEKGTITYLRLDDKGNTIQRGSKKPELKLISIETKCVSGSAVLETTEKACITARFANIGDISAPPNVLVSLSNVTNMTTTHGFAIDQWLEPGVEFSVKLYVELGDMPGNASFDLICAVHGGILYKGHHELTDIQHPVSICTILNTPHVVSGQEIELGAIIQNISGIATGNVHQRPVRAEITLEPGLVFLDATSTDATIQKATVLADGTACVMDVDDLKEAPERLVRRVTFARDLAPFSSRSWSFRLYWKDCRVGEVTGKVKMIPAYDAEGAQDADALIITHPGFSSVSFSRLLNVFMEFKLRVVTWDYYYYKGVKLSNHFRAKLILFCLRDAADIELLATEHIRAHFYGEDGSDQDSSMLILSPDAADTVSLLTRRLVEVGHDATEDETTRKFFGKPDTKDFNEVVHDIEKEWFPKFPDYAVWSSSKEAAVKTGSGMRARWRLGEVKVMKSTLSYFHRLYVMSCPFITNEIITNKEAENVSVAIRHSLTLSHKIYLIETDTRPGSAAATEAALYYDLKSEFFYVPRPLLFLKQVTDLLFQFTYRYATDRIVEAVLRCLYRLRTATYWKSFGFSDFKTKFATLESTLKRLKDTLANFAYELESTGNRRRLDFAAVDGRAQSGAKSSSRVKWRKQPLPSRIRDIPEKTEDLKVPPPAETSSGSKADAADPQQGAAGQQPVRRGSQGPAQAPTQQSTADPHGKPPSDKVARSTGDSTSSDSSSAHSSLPVPTGPAPTPAHNPPAASPPSSAAPSAQPAPQTSPQSSPQKPPAPAPAPVPIAQSTADPASSAAPSAQAGPQTSPQKAQPAADPAPAQPTVPASQLASADAHVPLAKPPAPAVTEPVKDPVAAPSVPASTEPAPAQVAEPAPVQTPAEPAPHEPPALAPSAPVEPEPSTAPLPEVAPVETPQEPVVPAPAATDAAPAEPANVPASEPSGSPAQVGFMAAEPSSEPAVAPSL